MSSLFDSLNKDVSFFNQTKTTRREDSSFPDKVAMYRDIAVNNYRSSGKDLNASIAKIATEKNLNDEQISRIIEEANTQVYLIKYAEMKNSTNRDVQFPLADLRVIKDMVENGIPKKASTIKKKASWENSDGDDPLNFLNYSSNEFCSLAPEKTKDLKDIVVEKLASDLNEKSKKLSEKRAAYLASVNSVAGALIKYDRAHQDTNGIFDFICKQASASKNDQISIKTAVKRKMSMMKEAKEVSESYDLNLKSVETDVKIEKSADYSLGTFSFVNNPRKAYESAPVVIADDGQVINRVQDLVEMVKSIEKKKKEVQQAEKEAESAVKKIAYISENV